MSRKILLMVFFLVDVNMKSKFDVEFSLPCSVHLIRLVKVFSEEPLPLIDVMVGETWFLVGSQPSGNHQLYIQPTFIIFLLLICDLPYLRVLRRLSERWSARSGVTASALQMIRRAG